MDTFRLRRALSFSVPPNDRDTYLLILATVTHGVGAVCWRICIFATAQIQAALRDERNGWSYERCVKLITRNWIDNGIYF